MILKIRGYAVTVTAYDGSLILSCCEIFDAYRPARLPVCVCVLVWMGMMFFCEHTLRFSLEQWVCV